MSRSNLCNTYMGHLIPNAEIGQQTRIKLLFAALTAHLFFLCNLHLTDHRIVQYIDNFGRGAVSDFVIQPPGADAVAQNRVRAVCHITRATKPRQLCLDCFAVIFIVRLFDQLGLLPDLKRLAAKTEFSSGDRDAGRQRNRALRKECFPNRLFHGKGNTA